MAPSANNSYSTVRSSVKFFAASFIVHASERTPIEAFTLPSNS